MSVAIHIYYTGNGDSARNFAKEMESSGIADAIRSEEGNLQYEYFLPVSDPRTVLLVDRWIDRKALEIHHHTPMMNEIIRLREKYGLHMKVERYTSDEEGIPAGDRRFIKE